MFFHVVLMDSTFISVLSQSVPKRLRCETYVIYGARPTGLVRTFKHINHIDLVFVFTLRGGVIPHLQRGGIVGTAVCADSYALHGVDGFYSPFHNFSHSLCFLLEISAIGYVVIDYYFFIIFVPIGSFIKVSVECTLYNVLNHAIREAIVGQ